MIQVEFLGEHVGETLQLRRTLLSETCNVKCPDSWHYTMQSHWITSHHFTVRFFSCLFALCTSSNNSGHFFCVILGHFTSPAWAKLEINLGTSTSRNCQGISQRRSFKMISSKSLRAAHLQNEVAPEKMNWSRKTV